MSAASCSIPCASPRRSSSASRPSSPSSSSLTAPRCAPGSSSVVGIERVQRVVEPRVERPWTARARGCVFRRNAERCERLSGSLQRHERLGGEKAAGHRRRHAARAGDGREQRMSIGDAEHALAVGDVIDRPGHRCDHAEPLRGLARELGRCEAGADRLDAAHLGRRADQRCHFTRIATQHGDVDGLEDPSRSLRPVRGRTHADRIEHDGHSACVRRVACEQHRVDPLFRERPDVQHERTTRDRPSPATSSRACAMTGNAPSASVAFAVSFMTT